VYLSEEPPIDEVIRSGAVPRFVELLSRDDCPELQLQAAWALVEIARGTSGQTRAVVDANAVPLLIRLIDSKDENVSAQCISVLGNIAGDDCIEYRDMLLHSGLVSALVERGMVRDLSALVFGVFVYQLSFLNVIRPFTNTLPWKLFV